MTVLAPAAPRLAVKFGSFDLNAAAGIVLDSDYDLRESSTEGFFSIAFRLRLLTQTGVVATDDSAFQALVAAAETALRLPRQTLTATLGAATPFVNWNFSGTQTAILIEPELELLEDNARDYKYRLRVRCQFPGNVPGNVFRRDSLTKVGTSLRENRVCSITATWTSSNGVTAYARYLASGTAFYNSYLPANSVDSHGDTGTWVRVDEDPGFNDENSLITATRVYWEVFAHGRRESQTVTVTTIKDRRVCTIATVWSATSGFTALQNYIDGGDALCASLLPTNVSSGQWVQVDERPSYNDQNGVCTVERVYHECVSGLREYNVEVLTDLAQARTLVVTGAFYDTTSTGGSVARTNYNNGIAGLISAVISAESVTHYEAVSTPKVTGYDTTGLRYMFRWTIKELIYPQSGAGSPTWDDASVTLETLEVKVSKPYLPQSVTAANPVTQLQTVNAFFTAVINKSNSTDPAALWASKFRAHVVYALANKLGVDVTSSVFVVSEDVGVGLDKNTLTGYLTIVVGNAIGGGALSIVRLELVQEVTQRPGRRFVGMADGTNFSFFPYRKVPHKTLHRMGMVEYIVGTGPPVLFATGDNVASGFGLIDTGVTAQACVDALNASGTLVLGTVAPNGWIVDPDAPKPYSYTDAPTTRGDGSGLQTVVHIQIQDWFYCAALAAGTTIIP